MGTLRLLVAGGNGIARKGLCALVREQPAGKWLERLVTAEKPSREQNRSGRTWRHSDDAFSRELGNLRRLLRTSQDSLVLLADKTARAVPRSAHR